MYTFTIKGVTVSILTFWRTSHTAVTISFYVAPCMISAKHNDSPVHYQHVLLSSYSHSTRKIILDIPIVAYHVCILSYCVCILLYRACIILFCVLRWTGFPFSNVFCVYWSILCRVVHVSYVPFIVKIDYPVPSKNIWIVYQI